MPPPSLHTKRVLLQNPIKRQNEKKGANRRRGQGREEDGNKKQRLEIRIFSSFGVDQPRSLSAHCSLKLLSLLFSAKISRLNEN